MSNSSNLFLSTTKHQRNIVVNKAKSQSSSKYDASSNSKKKSIDEKIFRSKFSFRKLRIYRLSLSYRLLLFFRSFINLLFSSNDEQLKLLLSLTIFRKDNQLITKAFKMLILINRSRNKASNNYDNLFFKFLLSSFTTLFKESSLSSNLLASLLLTSSYYIYEFKSNLTCLLQRFALFEICEMKRKIQTNT